MKVKHILPALLLAASPVMAADLIVSLELPQMQVAEYHRPYVALWLENERNESIQLAVWYDVDKREGKGQEWLKDMRQWWRRGGRSLELPIDGVTSATRGPGEHTLVFPLHKAPLAQLPAGAYRLRVEASREVGGREVVEVPLSWPLTGKPLTATGSHELGRIQVQVKP